MPSRLNEFFRKFIIKKNRFRLKNNNFSLISSNCNGGVILHELGLPFNSPFVNLWIRPAEYVKMCKSLHEYLSSNLVFIQERGIDYPVGLLKDDVRIYFMHYSTEKDAMEKWKRRLERINWDDLFILFTDRDGCTIEILNEFNKLSYRKVAFVHNPMPQIDCAAYIRGFEKETSVGFCSDFVNRYTWKRYYDDFDYVSWFNHEI